MAAKGKNTPVRRALKPDSVLQEDVMGGLGAVIMADRACFAKDIRTAFSDSLYLDEALAAEHPVENRWDYLIGHKPSQQVIAVEPHSARQGEVSTVIRKRKMALLQLRKHLKDGARISKWLWVSSGTNHFADTEKTRRVLDENGITFVGRLVLAKHLPKA